MPALKGRTRRLQRRALSRSFSPCSRPSHRLSGPPSSAMVHTTAIALLLRQAHLAAVYVEAAAELSHVVGHLFFWAARKVLTEYASPCPFSATIRERYFTAWSTPLTSSPSCIPSFTSTMTTPSSPESNTTSHLSPDT